MVGGFQERPSWVVALSPGGGGRGKKGGGSILDKPAVQIAAPKVAKPKAKEEVKVGGVQERRRPCHTTAAATSRTAAGNTLVLLPTTSSLTPASTAIRVLV